MYIFRVRWIEEECFGWLLAHNIYTFCHGEQLQSSLRLIEVLDAAKIVDVRMSDRYVNHCPSEDAYCFEIGMKHVSFEINGRGEPIGTLNNSCPFGEVGVFWRW